MNDSRMCNAMIVTVKRKEIECSRKRSISNAICWMRKCVKGVMQLHYPPSAGDLSAAVEDMK